MQQHNTITRCDKPVSFRALRCRMHARLAVVQHLQRKKRSLARAYVRLRRLHTHIKAQRALRLRLKQIHQAAAIMREVES